MESNLSWSKVYLRMWVTVFVDVIYEFVPACACMCVICGYVYMGMYMHGKCIGGKKC